MSQAWRRLVAWTLLLWLPLQGGAALAMGLCAAMQAAAPAAVVLATEVPAADTAAPCHGPESPAQPDATVAHDGAACAHCAACQAPAAAAPAWALFGAQTLPEQWQSARFGMPPAPLPDTLERPPKAGLV